MISNGNQTSLVFLHVPRRVRTNRTMPLKIFVVIYRVRFKLHKSAYRQFVICAKSLFYKSRSRFAYAVPDPTQLSIQTCDLVITYSRR